MEDRHYERVIRYVDRDDPTGCLVSRYSVGSHGYAQAWDGRTVVLAHRMVWEHHNGPIPDGMTVDHMCHNKRCIEITHLRCISNLENARMNHVRLSGKVEGQCVNGHPDETYWRPKGPARKKGYCHACRMDVQRERRRRKREQELTDQHEQSLTPG